MAPKTSGWLTSHQGGHPVGVCLNADMLPGPKDKPYMIRKLPTQISLWNIVDTT